MKKNLQLTVLVLLSLLLCQCSKSEFEELTLDEEFEQNANFPTYIAEYGKSIAAELRGTVKNLHKMGVDYSDANKTDAFKEKFYNNFYQASPTIIKTRSSFDMTQMQMNPKEFAERLSNLTKIQLDFIDRIIKECDKSTSYKDLANRLISINKDIYSNVPEIQQERLFTITAVLYYGMKEVQYLEEQGLMPATPQNKIKHLRIKTRSESGGGFGASCRSFLATVWVIAVGEPTPAGEIVAAVATVIVGGILLYEVVVCASQTIDCAAKYAECVNTGSLPSWKCYDCFRYCQGQHVWECPRPY